MTSTTPQLNGVITTISLIGLIVFWTVLAWLKADPTVLPTPLEVWHIARAEAASGELARHMIATIWRVAAAFGLAMTLGLIIGFAMGRNKTLDRWFGAWLVVFLNIPALVVIVLCYLWIGLNETAAIVAVALNKTAMVAVTIREGTRALDPQLEDMAHSFGMKRGTHFRHVVLPQLWPFIASSTRNGLAIIWKIVLVVEFLGRSDGIGFQIHLYFQLFEIGYVMAYAFSFVLFILALEWTVINLFEKRATKWRLAPGQI
ncbi:ABC transporter permease [Cognatiyoonia sp. IB215446]|uniref:ABC transporter permease n=1 Tax=Cognatiyoonia sp. IB215446 TaxID=3097355 RepID=UPI002A1716ED|nr:ABC transporter permease [Cognatiyoonia sp. IB215446]MDX8348921.1 ABC transporter permease [Cognatiyoonia sp. IB215446]